MKALYSSIAFLLFVVGMIPFPVIAEDTYVITGIVTEADTNESIAEIEIALTNLRTSETIHDVTNETGAFTFDLSDLEEGWISQDYMELSSPQITGYEAYSIRMCADMTAYQGTGNTWRVDMPIPPSNPSWQDTVMNLHTGNRKNSIYNFNLLRADEEEVFVPSNYNVIQVRASYDLYDDPSDLTYLVQYAVEMDYSIGVWTSGYRWLQPPLLTDADEFDHTIQGKGTPMQYDPFLSVELDEETFDDLDIDVECSITCKVYYNTNPKILISSWQDSEMISGMRYDFQ